MAMTENSIIKLGFVKCIVDKDDSGLDYDVHYYTYNVGNVCFTSNDNMEVGDGACYNCWNVEITGSDVKFYDYKDLKCTIDCLKRNTV